MNVLLLNMPFSLPFVPNAGLSVLKAALNTLSDVTCVVRYPSVRMSTLLGATDNPLSMGFSEFAPGEFLFSQAAFPE